MPKNNKKPSFKHYISNTSSIALNQEIGHDDHNDSEASGPSVRELLNRSRAQAGPSSGRARGGGGEWTVSTSCMPLLGAWPELDTDSTLTSISNTRTPRRAAGPSAPPSWRNAPKLKSKSTSEPILNSGITSEDLINSSALLGQSATLRSPVTGVPVSHFIYRAVIRYLDCPDIYDQEDGSTITYGEWLRGQVRNYRQDFKVGLLANYANHPSPRLSDKSIQAILLPPHDPDSRPTNDGDEWDQGFLGEMTHHLGITLHPDPSRLLRSINSLPNVALTSLNLAYSTIPHVEKLVMALPVGLKELGLVGIKCTSEETFGKMLGLLGRRLRLLHVRSTLLTSFGDPTVVRDTFDGRILDLD
jgi:hypothetical protein